ncbi:L-galactonate oxidoreductase [Agarivorans gilvus]|uniref:L-galactonate oxidoreductase n=1 Tax=Agarivorans gilvus TaxID=680279 RepID=UPI0012EE3D0B|nr:L-galactonate oxidoreductase [Agarivorans gilvus]
MFFKQDLVKVQQLMTDGKLRASMMLTHTFDFNTIGEHYQEQVVNNKGLLKGIISF